MSVPLEEMWKDLAEADRLGDEELARAIAARIKEAETSTPQEDEGGSGFWRGVAGGVTSQLAGGVASVADAIGEHAAFITGQSLLGVPEERQARPLTGVRDVARDVASAEAIVAEENRPEGFTKGAAYDLATAAGVMLPSIATGIVTKKPNLALTMMGIPAFGSGYEKAKAEGAGESEALREGFTQVAFELGPEKAFRVFDKALGKAPVKQMLKEVILAEGGSEITTESLNVVYEALIKGENVGEALDVLKRVGYAGMLGVLLGGGIGVANVPGRLAQERAQEAFENTPDQLDLNQPPQFLETEDGTRLPIQQEPVPGVGQVDIPYVDDPDPTRPPPGAEVPASAAVERQQSFDFGEQQEEGTSVDDGQLPLDLTGGGQFEQGFPAIEEEARQQYQEAANSAAAVLEARDFPEAWSAWENSAEQARLQEEQMFEDFERLGFRDDPEVQYLREEAELERRAAQEREAVAQVEAPLEEQRQLRLLREEIRALQRSEVEEGTTPEDQESIAKRTDEILNELDEESETLAYHARPENVPYSRGSDRGMWTVTHFNPRTRRVVAEYQTDNGKISATWTIDGGPAEPFHQYENPETGNATWRQEFSPGFSKGRSGLKVPNAFRTQVDNIFRDVVRFGGTLDTTLEEVRKAKKTGTRIFQGARPKETLIAEDKLTEQEIDEARDLSLGRLNESLERPVNFPGMPKIKEDTSAEVTTRVAEAELRKLKKGTAFRTRVYQVLPDGGIRVVEFRPKEDLSGYDAFAIGMNGSKFAEPVKIGELDVKIGPKVRKEIEALPGKTIAEKAQKQDEKVARESKAREDVARTEEKTSRIKAGTVEKTRVFRPSSPSSERDITGGLSFEPNSKEQRELNRAREEVISGRAKSLEEALANGLDLGDKPSMWWDAKKGRLRLSTSSEAVSNITSAYPTYEAQKKALADIIMARLEPFFESDVGRTRQTERQLAESGKFRVSKEGETQRVVDSGDKPISLSVRGQRQKALANKAVQAIVSSPTLPVEDMLKLGELIKQELQSNPEVGGEAARSDFGLINSNETYQTATFEELVKKHYPSEEARKRVQQLRDRGANRAIPAAEFIAILSEQVEESTAPRSAEQKATTDRRGEQVEGRRVEPRGIGTASERAMERVLDRYFKAGDVAGNVAEGLRKAVEEKMDEVSGPIRELTEELDALKKERGESTGLSRDALNKLEKLIESQKKANDPKVQEIAEARQLAKEAVKAANDARRTLAVELAALRAENARKEEAREQERLRKELEEQNRVEEEKQQRADALVPVLPVPGTTGVYAKYHSESEYVSAVREAVEAEREAAAKRKKKEGPKKEESPKTPKEEQLALELYIKEETQGEFEFERAKMLAANEEWLSTIDGKPRPSGRTREERQKTLPLESPDPVDHAVWEEAELVRTYKWAGPFHKEAAWALRRLWPSRFASLMGPSWKEFMTEKQFSSWWDKFIAKREAKRKARQARAAQRNTVTLESRLRGQIRASNLDTLKAWAQARAVLKKHGWKRGSKEWDNALNYYIEGIPHDYILKETGISIPEEARNHLNTIIALREEASRKGVAWGSWSNKNTRGAVIRGTPYLSHVAKQNWSTSRAISRQLDVLKDAARDAWGLPETPADVVDMSRSELLALLSDTKHNVWHQHVEPAPGEQPGDTEASTVLVYDDGKIRKVLGPVRDGETPQQALNRALEEVEVDPSLKGTAKTKAEKEAKTQATVQQLELLREVIISGLPTDETYANAVKSLVEDASAVAESPLARGRGAVQSIQKQRRLLKSQAQLIHDATHTIRRYLNKEDKQVFKTMLEGMDADYRKMTVKQFLDLIEEKIPGSAEGVRRARSEASLNKALREALNEVTDTEHLLARTMDAVSATVYTSEYLRSLVAVLIGTGQASLSVNRAGDWVPLSAPGTALGDSTFTPLGTNSFKKASDVYVSPEIRQTIRDIFAQDAGSYRKGGLAPIRWLSSQVKMFKVIISVLATSRNSFSTRLIHWFKNIWGVGGVEAKKVGGYLSTNQLMAAVSEQAESFAENKITNPDKQTARRAKALRDFIVKEATLYDGGQIGAVYDLQEQALGVTNDKTPEVMAFRRGLRRAKHIFEEAFRLGDESVKPTAVLHYTGEHLLIRGHDNKLLWDFLDGKKLTDNQKVAVREALLFSINLTLDTYPTFSRTSPPLKSLSRSIVAGAFPSFHGEIVRTSAATLHYGMDLVQAALSPNGKLFDGTKIVRRDAALVLGLYRILGQVGMWSAGSIAYSLAARALAEQVGLDDDDEEKEWGHVVTNIATRLGLTSLQRKLRSLHEWYSRDGLAVIEHVDLDTGNWRVRYLDYLMPTSSWEGEITKGAQRFLRAVQSGDLNRVEAAAHAIREGVMVPANVFFNVEVLLGTYMKRWSKAGSLKDYEDDRFLTVAGNTLQRVIQGDTGKYNLLQDESAQLRVMAAAAGGTLVETLPAPELVNQMATALQATAEELMRENPTWSQRVDFVADSFLYIAGYKHEDKTFKEDFPRIFSRDLRHINRAGTYMKAALAEQDFENYDQFKATFDEQNSIRKQAFDQVFYGWQGAEQVLKRSTEEIINTLKDAKVNESADGLSWQHIAAGAYEPPGYLTFVNYAKELDKETGKRKHERVAKERDVLLERIEWYERAMTEAGYEISKYE